MAFWGVQLKPNKPITHSCEKARGRRLRISQATLGLGVGTRRCEVLCNVGNRKPVLLCSLLPQKAESLHLDLEFQEADDVVFSVIGSRNVYLTGYYTDPYGVDADIRHKLQRVGEPALDEKGGELDNGKDELVNQNLPTTGGSMQSLDTRGIGESHFVTAPELDSANVQQSKKRLNEQLEVKLAEDTDDEFTEVDLFKQGSLQADGVTEHLLANNREVKQHKSEESSPEKVGAENQNVLGKDEAMQEAHANSNTEDLPAANGENKKDRTDREPYGMDVDIENTQADRCDTGEKIAQVTAEMEEETKNDGLYGSEKKQYVGPLDIRVKLERVREPPLDEKTVELDNGKDELAKQVESSEEIIAPIQELVHGSNRNETLIKQNLLTLDGSMQSIDLSKPKSKRKERRVIDKTSEVLPMARSKSRKKRKERHEIEKTSEFPTDNKDPSALILHKEHEAEASADLGIGESHLVTAPELVFTNGQQSKKRLNEQLGVKLAEGVEEKFTEVDLIMQSSLQADGVTEHLLADNGKQHESEETSPEKVGAENQSVLGKGEAMQEAHAESSPDDLSAANGENRKNRIDSNISAKSELLAKKDRSTKSRWTLSNGLSIEELRSGPPGGRVALPGKKVKIYYTGMFEENRNVFDSNVDKDAFRFRLGDEEIIEGWNAGIDGMHVGDKRRLILPPSLGFGEHGSGQVIPPHSWLIYDIELLSVHR